VGQLTAFGPCPQLIEDGDWKLVWAALRSAGEEALSYGKLRQRLYQEGGVDIAISSTNLLALHK
jgi:hypothetical protein